MCFSGPILACAQANWRKQRLLIDPSEPNALCIFGTELGDPNYIQLPVCVSVYVSGFAMVFSFARSAVRVSRAALSAWLTEFRDAGSRCGGPPLPGDPHLVS